MDLNAITTTVTEFVRAHQAWAPLIVAALAFGETLAFVSILIPSTVILVGIGGLVAAGALEFTPIWLGALVGAVLGFTTSYWIGRAFGPKMLESWPLNKDPGMVDRGRAFFQRWGVGGVFLGHFFGPLRAVVPLAAGVAAMPIVPFQIANVAAAAVWAYALPKAGELGGDAVGAVWQALRTGGL